MSVEQRELAQLNGLVGQKVTIVKPRVQTTICRIAGIATYAKTQNYFLGTPDIFEPGSWFDRPMVKASWRSGFDVDFVANFNPSIAKFIACVSS